MEQPLKKKIFGNSPFDEKHTVQSILKFLPLRSVFLLSRVSRNWSKFLKLVTFHPERITFLHGRNAVSLLYIAPIAAAYEGDSHSCFGFPPSAKGDDAAVIDLSDISSSRLPNVLAAVECIQIYDNVSLDFPAHLFCNVKEIWFKTDMNAALKEFYFTLAPRLRCLLISKSCTMSGRMNVFFEQCDFSNVEVIEVEFDEFSMRLDYKTMFPKLRVFQIWMYENKIPITLQDMSTLSFSIFGNYENRNCYLFYYALHDHPMPNVENVILHFDRPQSEDAKELMKCELMKRFEPERRKQIRIHIAEGAGLKHVANILSKIPVLK